MLQRERIKYFLGRYIETIFCQKLIFWLKTFVKWQKRLLYGKSDGEIPVCACTSACADAHVVICDKSQRG